MSRTRYPQAPSEVYFVHADHGMWGRTHWCLLGRDYEETLLSLYDSLKKGSYTNMVLELACGQMVRVRSKEAR